MKLGQGSMESSDRSKPWITLGALLLVLAAGPGRASGGASPPPAPKPAPHTSVPEILRLADVKPGMKGYGLTVVSGEKIERFEVEVLGVMPNGSPGRPTIVVRLSGLGLEESGVVAGMSGSPVFLDGKLAGAVSSGWGFSKQPIGNLTPIEQMLPIDSAEPLVSAPYRPATGLDPARFHAALAAMTSSEEGRIPALRAFLDGFPQPLAARGGAAGGSRSLLLPASLGIPFETFQRFGKELAGLGLSSLADVGAASALQGSGPRETAPSAPLTFGSAMTALLVDGDLRLGATGTVTNVTPDGRFVAFGHPFLSFGDLELPVAPARVVTVLPNAFQSFKLAYPLEAVYRLTRDRDSGIAGRMDRTAPMVPVRFRFEAAPGQVKTMSWSVAPSPRLLPILLSITTDAALTLVDPTPRERTLRFRVQLETAAGPVAYEDDSTGARAKEIATLSTATLAALIGDNDLEDPRVSGVELSFRSAPGERRLRLAGATLVSRRVTRGGSVSASLRFVDRRGQETVRVVTVPVPKETPEGKATLVLLDGSNASMLRFALEPVEPRTLAGLVRALGRLVPTNRLLAAVVVPSRGAATGTGALTALPPSAAALLSGSGEPGEAARPDVPSRLLAEELLTFDRPVAGSLRLDFEVERPRT